MATKLHETLLTTPDGIYIHIYSTAKNFTDTPAVDVICPGMPNYPDKDFFKTVPNDESLRTYAVVYYAGYWYSDGYFDTAQSSASIALAVRALRHGKLSERVNNTSIPAFTGQINVHGYSYGANPLLRALPHLRLYDIARVTLVAPLALIHKDDLASVDNHTLAAFYAFNAAFSQFVSHGCKNVIRKKSPDTIEQYFAGGDELSRVTVTATDISSVEVYYGTDDIMITPKLLAPLLVQIAAKHCHKVDGVGHDKTLLTVALQATDQ